MFQGFGLLLLTLAFFSPFQLNIVPDIVKCENVSSLLKHSNSPRSHNFLTYRDLILFPVGTPRPSQTPPPPTPSLSLSPSTIQLLKKGLQSSQRILVPVSSADHGGSTNRNKNTRKKSSKKKNLSSLLSLMHRTGASSPRKPSYVKNHHYSSYHKTRKKGGNRNRKSRDDGGSTMKKFYSNLVQKLLRPKQTHSRDHSPTSSDSYNGIVSATAHSSPSSGWGWGGWGKGWGGGGGGGHKGGMSLLELLCLKLSLLSLAGFLLNLLLNLANLFGFGMMTSTATYPVEITQTVPGTGIPTTPPVTITTGSAVSGLSYPGVTGTATGLGLTARTLDSLQGGGWGRNQTNSTTPTPGWGWRGPPPGWGWKGPPPGWGWKKKKGWGWKKHHHSGWGWHPSHSGPPGWGWPDHQAKLKLHLKSSNKGWGWGWPTGNGTGWNATTTPTPLESLIQGGAQALSSLIRLKAQKGRRIRKRETFKPYVDPITSLEVFAKAVLNSVGSARHQFQCMEGILCENNKQARIVGQWLEYFMPVYSFSLSHFGQRIGAHYSLFDHLRAIVLGATETNCKIHFPPCGDNNGTVK